MVDVPPEPRGVQRRSKSVDDGFTAVRRPRPAAGNPSCPIVFTAGNTGGPTDRALKEIPQVAGKGNIALSNAFDRLREDTDNIVSGEKNIMDENNKENFMTKGKSRDGKEIIQSKGASVDGKAGQSIRGAKGGLRDKRSGPMQGNGYNGLRKKPTNNTHSRGLIFGPTTYELERPALVKRLRIESDLPGQISGQLSRAKSGTGPAEMEISGQSADPVQSRVGSSGGEVTSPGDDSLGLPVPTGRGSNGEDSMQLVHPSNLENPLGGVLSGSPANATVVSSLGSQ